MIYTSYFGNLKNLSSNCVPIAICGKSPDWYNGLEFKKLAPKYSFFMEWKKNHDNDYYIEHFNKEVLEPLNPNDIIKELLLMAHNYKNPNYAPHIVLLCYEKPTDFCHRHLVAQWLIQNGFECEEYKS